MKHTNKFVAIAAVALSGMLVFSCTNKDDEVMNQDFGVKKVAVSPSNVVMI